MAIWGDNPAEGVTGDGEGICNIWEEYVCKRTPDVLCTRDVHLACPLSLVKGKKIVVSAIIEAC
jgi:hypothetical protein